MFKPLPRLCYRLDASTGRQGELVLPEREAVFDTLELDLLGQVVGRPGFTMVEQAAAWEVCLGGQKLRVGRGEAIVAATLRHLVHEQRLPLEQLAQHQHALMQQLALRIAGYARRVQATRVRRRLGWAGSSGGRCCFAMVFELEDGMTMTQQIDAAPG